MAFASLLGNERLKQNLQITLSRGHISHFYLIFGPEGSGRHTLARLLAAAILCREKAAPCLRCNTCRKVMANTHPDFITVDDPEKKTVPVDLIRQARADIYIQPNESEHKIYLFPRAQDMGIPSQNALLKILEEPPKYGVFILLTNNPEQLLPTVRSRCTPLSLQPLAEPVLADALKAEFPKASPEDIASAVMRSAGFLGQAKKVLENGATLPVQVQSLAEGFAAKDACQLLATLAPMEKWKRDQLIPVLQQFLELLEGSLACRAGIPGNALAQHIGRQRSSQDLMQAISHLQKALEYAQGNVSVGAICGYICWHLR